MPSGSGDDGQTISVELTERATVSFPTAWMDPQRQRTCARAMPALMTSKPAPRTVTSVPPSLTPPSGCKAVTKTARRGSL